MHHLEPFYNWRHIYISEEDENSTLFQREYSEFQYTQKIYNYFIHPQWDEIGSPTLFLKVLCVDYDLEYAIIELIGEWNDCIHNDVMFLKKNLINQFIKHGIHKFILIGENVLNFHSSDDCYYEEWWDDVKEDEGWIVGVNFRDHVLEEMKEVGLQYYMELSDKFEEINWRTMEPKTIYYGIEQVMMFRLNA